MSAHGTSGRAASGARRRHRLHRLHRLGAGALGGALAAVLAGVLAAPTASAHVTVDPSTAPPGGWTVLTLRVPTESDTASTVAVTVKLPTDTPFASVRTQPVPGWTAKVTTATLPTPITDDDGNTVTSAPSEVTWTATGAGLGPGQFQELKLSVGPLPSSGTLYLPAIQRYSDGTEVDWVQQATGSAEPEHPAPAVTISPSDDGSSGTAQQSDGPVAEAAGSRPTGSAAGTGAGSGWMTGLAAAALVVALAAVGVAARTTLRVRR